MSGLESGMLVGIGARPVRHSLTPVAWNAAFNYLGMNFRYESWSAPTLEELEDKLKAIRTDSSIRGFNVTLPWKEEVAKRCELADHTSKAVGAVNTVHNTPAGFEGFNTDGWGAVMALAQAGADIDGGTAVIAGAGGAARSIAYELAKAGAKVFVLNRTPERASVLCDVINQSLENKMVCQGLDEMKYALPKATVFVNTTPLGGNERPGESILSLEEVLSTPEECVFLDAVYNPSQTPLLGHAAKAGRAVVPGSEMLIMQAVKGFEIFFTTPPSGPAVEKMRGALEQALEEHEKAREREGTHGSQSA